MKHATRVAGGATIIDVAREAGVSYTTVSRVLNEKNHVRADKRERVLEAMTRLGYVVNQHARSLAAGRTRLIGLLVPELSNDYIGEIVCGIDEELETGEYDLLLSTTHWRKASEATYAALLSGGLTDGLLVVLPRNSAAYLTTLQQRRVPYVLIDHHGIESDGPAVGVTNWQGAYDATRYLLGLGHRRIGFIMGKIDLGCTPERLAGYQAALAEASVEADLELVREGDFNKPRGYAAARELLALPQPPTAIFASNDTSAFGVIEAARDCGVRIPDHLSLVGFDDIPATAHVHPALTTVRQPLRQMGHVGIRLLLEIIEQGQSHTGCVDLATELVIRESCCPPRL